ncbi:dermatopontin-like [Gigantopelta aegis]|uniref:dermatopontin-like n=1 Tax=Gigantopelta aegis TaxID=1735272 RepID=UPI001B88D592|nr:dermatopontin-like [Gigantopelta aegis]
MKLLACVAVFVCIVGSVHCWENWWDRPFQFSCPSGESLRRINSQHSNRYEDRLWKFDCIHTGAKAACVWSGYVNGFDDPLLFQCANNGVITGIGSYHSNPTEDRRFKFRCCSIPGKTLKNCRFSTSYHNTFDNDLNYYIPSNKVLKGAFSYHSNRHEDRRWKFEVCDKP